MGMNVDYKGVEVGNLPVNSSAQTVAGRPVRISGGEIYAHNGLAKCIGLIKESRISGVVDEITGDYGIYGSGNGTILADGVATVKQSVYAGVSYAVYDEAQTYSSGDDLYADTNGLISNQAPAGIAYAGVTGQRVGYVLTPPTNAADGDPMTIRVDK